MLQVEATSEETESSSSVWEVSFSSVLASSGIGVFIGIRSSRTFRAIISYNAMLSSQVEAALTCTGLPAYSVTDYSYTVSSRLVTVTLFCFSNWCHSKQVALYILYPIRIGP